MSDLGEEDRKLVTLARGAMGRAGAAHGAAVRDLDGRSYAGAPVSLAALQLTGLQVAVATALASGATGFESAILVGAADGTDPGAAALAEVSADVPIIMVDVAGRVRG